MTTNTSQGVASRIGYGLGRCVRVAWFSEDRSLRWIKRLAVILIVAYSWLWLASALMAVLTGFLILLAITKLDLNNSGLANSKSYQPYSSLSETDCDPNSLANQNNPLFHASYDDNFFH